MAMFRVTFRAHAAAAASPAAFCFVLVLFGFSRLLLEDVTFSSAPTIPHHFALFLAVRSPFIYFYFLFHFVFLYFPAFLYVSLFFSNSSQVITSVCSVFRIQSFGIALANLIYSSCAYLCLVVCDRSRVCIWVHLCQYQYSRMNKQRGRGSCGCVGGTRTHALRLRYV